MLVVFAISATALLATVGLLYSFGYVLSERRTLQTAADAASLRGAWQVLSELQSDDRLDANVRNVVVRYAASNGVANPSDVSGVYVDGSGASTGTTLGCGCVFPASARGVRVSVNGLAPTLLPGFVGASQVLVQTSATATARATASPTSETLVMPIGVYIGDYAPHAQYDLFRPGTAPLGQPPTLDLRAAGASDHGPPMSTNLQFWSDGQDANGTVLTGRTLPLAGSAAYDSIAAGLADNVRRQNLRDASGAQYAIITLPIWDSTAPPGSVRIGGFARFKIRAADVKPASAIGVFVPYPAGAFGVPSTSGPDFGASLVGIVS